MIFSTFERAATLLQPFCLQFMHIFATVAADNQPDGPAIVLYER